MWEGCTIYRFDDLEDEINTVLNALYVLLKKIMQDEDIYEKDIYDVIKDMEY